MFWFSIYTYIDFLKDLYNLCRLSPLERHVVKEKRLVPLQPTSTLLMIKRVERQNSATPALGIWGHFHEPWFVRTVLKPTYFYHTSPSVRVSLNENLSLTNSVEQSSSWEINSWSGDQQRSCRSWNPKIHFCVHKSPLLVLILSHMNSVPILPQYFFKIYFNIIHLRLDLPSGLFPSFFYQYDLRISHLLHAC
jgi:hypothetical protein